MSSDAEILDSDKNSATTNGKKKFYSNLKSYCHIRDYPRAFGKLETPKMDIHFYKTLNEITEEIHWRTEGDLGATFLLKPL